MLRFIKHYIIFLVGLSKYFLNCIFSALKSFDSVNQLHFLSQKSSIFLIALLSIK